MIPELTYIAAVFFLLTGLSVVVPTPDGLDGIVLYYGIPGVNPRPFVMPPSYVVTA